jgi:predicted molibdopterin-dependent oxidoreductase YjgC
MTEITFEGRPVAIRPGQSIGAALLTAGIRSWRTTHAFGAPRGLYCGIGACFECLVTVNGRPAQRACAVEARPGDVVEASDGV